MRMSICIPTSEMEGRELFLTRSLEALWNQTMQDFEIVVSDNSEDDEIWKICKWFGGIKYMRNPIKGMAQNTNHAMKRSEGTLIKVLYMDDYLAHPKALETIWNNFSGQWLVTGCVHSDGRNLFNVHKPTYNDEIYLGKNTVGSPSVMTIRNDNVLFFDEKMTWLLDCDYYKRMYDEFGLPVLLDDVNVVMGIGPHQATNTMGDEVKMEEYDYITTKYE